MVGALRAGAVREYVEDSKASRRHSWILQLKGLRVSEGGSVTCIATFLNETQLWGFSTNRFVPRIASPTHTAHQSSHRQTGYVRARIWLPASTTSLALTANVSDSPAL